MTIREVEENPLLYEQKPVTIWSIFKKAWIHYALLFMTFFISSILFPSIFFQKVPLMIVNNP